jgi:hypothetical protein
VAALATLDDPDRPAEVGAVVADADGPAAYWPAATNARTVSSRYAGFWAVGQEENFTATVRVARSTSTIWPWIPRQTWRSPSTPGMNQNWLRYHPPVRKGSSPTPRTPP